MLFVLLFRIQFLVKFCLDSDPVLWGNTLNRENVWTDFQEYTIIMGKLDIQKQQ